VFAETLTFQKRQPTIVLHSFQDPISLLLLLSLKTVLASS